MEFLGIFLPVLIDLVNRRFQDTELRFWVSFLICSLVGIFLNWLQTAFSFVTPMEGFESITASILSVFALAQLSYKAVWEKAPVREGLGLKAETPVPPDDNIGDGGV